MVLVWYCSSDPFKLMWLSFNIRHSFWTWAALLLGKKVDSFSNLIQCKHFFIIRVKQMVIRSKRKIFSVSLKCIINGITTIFLLFYCLNPDICDPDALWQILPLNFVSPFWCMSERSFVVNAFHGSIVQREL